MANNFWNRNKNQVGDDHRDFIVTSTLQGLFGNGIKSLAVNERSILGQSAVWSALNLISGDIGSLPVKVYDRKPDGGRNQVPTNSKTYLPYLLSIRPNNYQTSVTFFTSMVLQYLLYRNIFILKSRNQGGEVVELHLIHPTRINLKWDSEASAKYYEVDQAVLSDKEIIHIYGMSFDGISGTPLLTAGAEVFQANGFIQKYAAMFFKNNANPAGILTAKNQKLDKTQKDQIQVDWKSRYGGIENQYAIAVLDGEVVFQPISSNARDSQLIEQRAYSNLDICRLFNIPPHKLGDLTKSSYSSIEAQGQEYWQSTLRPIVVQIETSLNVGLIPESLQGIRYIEMDYTSIIKPDSESQVNQLDKLVKAGLITQNEARAKLNLPAMAGADKLIIQQNVALLNDDGSISPVNKEGTQP